MTEQQRNVDGLLAVAAERMLRSGEMAQQMRNLQRDGADERYWRMAQQIAEHLVIVGHCLTESHRILLAQAGGTDPGMGGKGLPN
jgi:hypothetical protein